MTEGMTGSFIHSSEKGVDVFGVPVTFCGVSVALSVDVVVAVGSFVLVGGGGEFPYPGVGINCSTV